MKTYPKMKFYLSGPMTGLPDLNFPRFAKFAAHLRSTGVEVVNPAEFKFRGEPTWEKCMCRDIAELVRCNAIAMLPGWQKSRGATLEHHIACQLDFFVVAFTEEFLP